MSRTWTFAPRQDHKEDTQILPATITTNQLQQQQQQQPDGLIWRLLYCAVPCSRCFLSVVRPEATCCGGICRSEGFVQRHNTIVDSTVYMRPPQLRIRKCTQEGGLCLCVFVLHRGKRQSLASESVCSFGLEAAATMWTMMGKVKPPKES